MTRLGAWIVQVASWALVGALFVAPLALGKLVETRDLWAHIALCAIAGAAALGALLAGAPRLRLHRADAALLSLLLAYGAASFVTVYARGTLLELMRLLDYLALYAAVRTLLRSERLLVAGAVAFACGGAACAVLGLREYLPTALAGDPSWRAFGPFLNPNLLAAMLLMVIPLWIALLSMSRLPVMRVASVLGLVLCWFCFFVTGSKGGALSLLGALTVGAIVAPDPAKGGLLKRALIGVGLVAFAGAAALLLPPIRVRLAQALGPQSNSTMFRYYTWLGTWHMMLARPLLGFGPGTFGVAYPRFAIVGHTDLAHETYLQVAAETGLVGAAALFAALGTQLAAAARAARRLAGDRRTVSAACAAGMVGFCLHNAVDYAWHVTATGMAFWILAGLVGAAWEGDAQPPSSPDPEPKKPSRKRTESRRVPWIAVAGVALALALLILPAGLLIHAAGLAAVGDYEAAARFDPLNDVYPREVALMAQQAARQGRPELYQRADAEWGRVQRLRPTYPGTPYNLGLIAQDQGDADRGLAEYREAEARAPTWTKAILAEAELLDNIGRHDEALRVYERLAGLAESPLFRYPAVSDDLDPSYAYAWLAIGDSEPADRARPLYVRAARYLRRVMAANRSMEGVWRQSGEWERKQSPELADLCEEVARRHVSFEDPGPRLRAALLLVDAGRPQLAEELLLPPRGRQAERALFERVMDGWADHVAATHLQTQGRFEAADPLIRGAAAELSEALASPALASLRDGPYGWTEAEMAALRQPEQTAKALPPERSTR
jgi:O-antigen ligase/tetratricopeptide (TPR) repeat protein